MVEATSSDDFNLWQIILRFIEKNYHFVFTVVREDLEYPWSPACESLSNFKSGKPYSYNPN